MMFTVISCFFLNIVLNRLAGFSMYLTFGRGEFGCYNKTPYSIKIAWTKDITDILVEKGIAYSYWGHKGGFGFINNNGQVSDVTLLNILTGN